MSDRPGFLREKARQLFELAGKHPGANLALRRIARELLREAEGIERRRKAGPPPRPT